MAGNRKRSVRGMRGPLAGIAILGGCLPLLAPAQQPTAPQAPAQSAAVTLDRVQVTATRTPRDRDDVPAAVSVLAGDALRRDSPGIGLSEQLAGVPGVLARNRQNLAQDEQISIRGFGARSPFGIRGVRMFVDGIPATMPDGQGQVSHIALGAADRIEVLRGPFSALHGNGAGGVLQVFTAPGTEPDSIGLSAAGGSDGTWRTGIDARGADGPFDHHLSATRFDTAGTRPHASARRDTFNARLGFALGRRASLLLAGNAFDAPLAQDPLGLTFAQFRADPRQAAPAALLFDTRKQVRQRQLGAILDTTLGHAAGGEQRARVLAYAGTRSIDQFLAIPVAAQANPRHGGGNVVLDSDFAGVDARWSHAGTLGGRPLELVLGLNRERQWQHRRGYENFSGTRLGVRGASRLDQHDRVGDDAWYAQASWDPAAAWTLHAGVRHGRVRFRSRDRHVTPGNPDDSGGVAYSATTPVVGVRWRIDPAWRVHAAYGAGFETPTGNELAYRGDGGSGPNFALRPARTRSAEAGIGWRDDADANAELTLFSADTRDELAVQSNSGGRTTFQNAGRARRAGAELSAALPLARGWRAQFAATWLRARYRDGFLTCLATPCPVPDTRIAAGTRLPGVPRASAHAALRYGAGQGWQARIDAQHVAAVTVDTAGARRAPGYTVFGATGGYRFHGARGDGHVFAGVSNLFDRTYAGSVIVNESNGRFLEPAPGRGFVLGMEWRWRE